jgi:hypothetical protein
MKGTRIDFSGSFSHSCAKSWLGMPVRERDKERTK